MYEDMVPYLLMVRKNKKEARVDTELVYAYAKINDLAKLEDFLATPNSANQQSVADRCFDEGLYEAARLLYTALSNWSCLVSTLLKLRLFQSALDTAKKANSPRTWKEVCFTCLEEDENKLAQLAGLNIIIQADELDSVSEYYQVRGKFSELIALMEAGVGVDRAHMGIFTELSILSPTTWRTSSWSTSACLALASTSRESSRCATKSLCGPNSRTCTAATTSLTTRAR